MKTFPQDLSPNYNILNLTRISFYKEKLRIALHEFLLSRYTKKADLQQTILASELKYFSLEDYTIQLQLSDITNVLAELSKLGWKYKYSFNDTGVFIYSTEEVPANCW